MGTSFLKLTNNVLDRLNEVRLDQNNFNTAKGIHASTKEAVASTVQKINNQLFQNTLVAASASQLLVPGMNEYPWPSNFMNADWTSFQIVKDDLLAINSRVLRKVNREQWYGYARDLDNNNLLLGTSVPTAVFEGHGQTFGVTPAPDKAYTLNYRYYKRMDNLVNWDDTSVIPDNFDYVITNGAIALMKLFKEDSEQYTLMRQEFREAMSEMRALLLNRSDTMTDSRVPRAVRTQGFI